VEFALLLPVLILLIMGVLDFARAFNVMQVVTNAAREGARSGIIPTNTSGDVTNTVNTYLASAGQAGCNTAGANLGSAGNAGDTVTVTVTCPFQTLTGTLIPGWSGTFNLSQTATMRHE
jgi:Flp pilus assembly protein TadG